MLKCANLKKKNIRGAESSIEGAELSIGGPRATPKVYKLTPVLITPTTNCALT